MTGLVSGALNVQYASIGVYRVGQNTKIGTLDPGGKV